MFCERPSVIYYDTYNDTRFTVLYLELFFDLIFDFSYVRKLKKKVIEESKWYFMLIVFVVLILWSLSVIRS